MFYNVKQSRSVPSLCKVKCEHAHSLLLVAATILSLPLEITDFVFAALELPFRLFGIGMAACSTSRASTDDMSVDVRFGSVAALKQRIT